MQIRAMKNSCSLNGLQNTWNLRHVGSPGRVKEMEMARSEDRISARRGLVHSYPISELLKLKDRSYDSFECDFDIPRRGASILATRRPSTSVNPRKLRRVRAGRTTRSWTVGAWGMVAMDWEEME
jgi:hypothetical protein